MRIRKKLLVLHTAFSLVLAVVLLLVVRPAVTALVTRAEADEAVKALELLSAQVLLEGDWRPIQGLTLAVGPPSAFDLPASAFESASRSDRPVAVESSGTGRAVRGLGMDASGEARFAVASARIDSARRAVVDLYLFVVGAVLAVYALIAVALEIFVLPQSVYGPIRRMLEADLAVQQGDAGREIIAEAHIPEDELGEIMRSRNESVRALRRGERDLGEALGRLEQIAADLTKKNHLLEAAQRNLADADRLASLGMMSAGIAHELNTPLTVVKGLAEKLGSEPDHALSASEAALLLRVVRRLERLGESLLDFARVRPPTASGADLAELVDEALTLVRLDRQVDAAAVQSRVEVGIGLECDPDRIVQVLVNLIRNGVDAVRGGPASGSGRVVVTAEPVVRDGSDWVSVRVTDDGTGIDSDRLEAVFEPFVSSKLDARGTGLGLAVAQGIVSEHGGVISATNRPGRRGAVFEVLLPRSAAGGMLGSEGGADGDGGD